TPSLQPSPTGPTVRVLIAPPITVDTRDLVPTNFPADPKLPPMSTPHVAITTSPEGLIVHVQSTVHVESHWLGRRFHIPGLGFLPSMTEDVKVVGSVPIVLEPVDTGDLDHAIVVKPGSAPARVDLQPAHLPPVLSKVITGPFEN